MRSGNCPLALFLAKVRANCVDKRVWLACTVYLPLSLSLYLPLSLAFSHYLCMCLCAHMDLSVLAIQNGMHFTKNCAFPVKMTTTTRLLTTPAACLCAPRSLPLAISLSGAACLCSFSSAAPPQLPPLSLCRSLLTLFCLLARWYPLRLWGFSS